MLRRDDPAEFIRAAGGVVWRDCSRTQLAVIYRDRYEPDECSLPKGKLDEGEDWEQAAAREVQEETGCMAEACRFAGLLHYYVGSNPKVVVFFEMVVVEEGRFHPSSEVRAIDWMDPREALEKLTHEDERQVVRSCLDSSPLGDGNARG